MSNIPFTFLGIVCTRSKIVTSGLIFPDIKTIFTLSANRTFDPPRIGGEGTSPYSLPPGCSEGSNQNYSTEESHR